MQPQDVIYFMIAGVNLILFSIVGIALFQAGLFMPFVKAKMSRGKKLIVRVLSPVQSYFVNGTLDEGYLVFRDRKKQDRRILWVEGCVDRAAGVYWVSVDDELNCMVRRMDGTAVDGHDAVKYDELLKRCLMKPDALNDLLQKITVICVVLLILGVIALIVLAVKNGKTDSQILSTLQTLVNITKPVGVVN